MELLTEPGTPSSYETFPQSLELSARPGPAWPAVNGHA
jgi:hypothetical protein